MKKNEFIGNFPKLEGVQTFYLFCANTSLKIESK